MIKRLSAALIGWAIVLGGAQQGWASPPSEDTSTIGLDGDGGPRRTDDPAPPPEVEEILASRRVARDAALRRFDVTPQGVVASELSSASSVTALNGDVPTYSSYKVNNWQPQQWPNWCGPASMRMALSHMSVVKTQSELAASVGITCGGTGTYLGTMHSVLNGIGGAASRGTSSGCPTPRHPPTSQHMWGGSM